ncbi:MAG: gamma carbonic anhydrase family protein [Terriglobales bacterium]
MLKRFHGHHPKIAATAFIEDSAQVIGDVVVGEHSSIWFHAVVRGDVNAIRIGSESNLQDLCVVHGFKAKFSVSIGDRVSVAHSVCLHGCTVEDDCLIGIGAIIMNGARIGRGSIIAAGALVPEGVEVPPGSVFMGSPARLHRQATDADRRMIATHAANYIGYKDQYLRPEV